MLSMNVIYLKSKCDTSEEMVSKNAAKKIRQKERIDFRIKGLCDDFFCHVANKLDHCRSF